MVDFAALGIKVDTGDLKRAIDFLSKVGKEAGKTESKTNSLGKSFDKTSKSSAGLVKSTLSLNSALKSVAGTLSILALASKARELVQFADSMTLLDSRIKISTLSIGDYNTAQKLLAKISLETGTQLKSNIILFSRINKSIGDMGGTISETARFTETLVKALSISGATSSETTSVVRQMSQALASGVLRGDEFNSIVENGSRVQGILADSLDVTKGELREMSQTGQLTSVKVINAILEQSKIIDSEFARLPVTVNRALNNIETQFGVYILEINKSIDATGSLSGALDSLASNLVPIINGLVTLGKVAVSVFAGSLIKSLLSYTAAKISAISLEKTHSATILENMRIDVVRAKTAVASSAKVAQGHIFTTTAVVNHNIAIKALSQAELALAGAANVATASLTKMQVALGIINVAIAAIVAWQVGTWARDNFAEARTSGLVFVGAMLTGFENLKLGGVIIWETIKISSNLAIELMQEKFASFLSFLANASSNLGFDDLASKLNRSAIAFTPLISAQDEFTKATNDALSARNKEINAIDENIIALIQYELESNNVKDSVAILTNNTLLNTSTVTGNTKALKDQESALAKIASLSSKFDEASDVSFSSKSIVDLKEIRDASIDNVKSLKDQVAITKEWAEENKKNQGVLDGSVESIKRLNAEISKGINVEKASIKELEKKRKIQEDLKKATSDYKRELESLNNFGDIDSLFPSISEESLKILEMYSDKIEPTKEEFELLTQAVREQQKVMEEWSGLLQGTFSDLLNRGQSFTQNLSDLFDNMIDRMLNKALEFASNSIINSLFNGGSFGSGLFGAAVGAAAIGVSFLLDDGDAPKRSDIAPSKTTTSGDTRALGFSDQVAVDVLGRDLVFAKQLVEFRKLNENVNRAASKVVTSVSSLSKESISFAGDIFSDVFPSTSSLFSDISKQITNFTTTTVKSSKLLSGFSDVIGGVGDSVDIATNSLSIGFGKITDAIGLTANAALKAEIASLPAIDSTAGLLAKDGIDLGGSGISGGTGAALKTIGAVASVLTAAFEVYTLISGFSDLTTGQKVTGIIGAVTSIGVAGALIGAQLGLVTAAATAAATVIGIVVAVGLLIASFFTGGKKAPAKISLQSQSNFEGLSAFEDIASAGIGAEPGRIQGRAKGAAALSPFGIVSSNVQHTKLTSQLFETLQDNVRNIVAIDQIIADSLDDIDKLTGDKTVDAFNKIAPAFQTKQKLKRVDFASLIQDRMNFLADNLALTGTPGGIAFNAWFDFFSRAFGPEQSLGIAKTVAENLQSLMELPLSLIGLLNDNIKAFSLGGTPSDASKEIETILLTFASLKAGFEILGDTSISDKQIVTFLAKMNAIGFAVNEAGASLLQYAQVLESTNQNISQGIRGLFEFADNQNFNKRDFSNFFSTVGAFSSLSQSLDIKTGGFQAFAEIATIVGDIAERTLDVAEFDSLKDQAEQFGGLTVSEARKEIESLGLATGDAILQVVNNVVFLNSMLEITGNTFSSMGKTLLETVTFSQDVIEAMGGFEESQSKWSAFIQAIYSDVEIADINYKQTARSANLLLESIGLGGLAFTEFRSAFDAAVPRLSAEDLSIWVDTGIAIGAANDAMSDVTDTLVTQFETINNAATQRYESELRFIKQINEFVDGLLVNESLSPLTNKERLVETQSQFSTQLVAAQAGDTDALGGITQFASKFLTEARSFYASSDVFTQIFNAVTSSLSGLGDLTGSIGVDPLNVIDDTLKEQTLALIQSSELSSEVIIAALDRVFSFEQLNSFGLVPTEEEKSIASDTAFINGLFQDAFGFLPDQFNFDTWMDKLLNGDSRLLIANQFETVSDPFKNIPQFADGGFHNGGLAIVGENGAELVNFNRPSQIFTSSQTSEIFGGNETSKEIVELIKQLIDENRELTESLIDATYDSSEQNASSINNNMARRSTTKMEVA